MQYITLTLLLSFVLLYGCVEPIHPYDGVAPGVWGGKLYLQANKSIRPGVGREDEHIAIEDNNDIDILPFLFEVIYDNDSTWHIDFINGSERITVRDIRYERTREEADKILKISFPIYDTYIEAKVKDGVMQGEYVVAYKDNYKIPFVALYNREDRFIRTSLDTTSSIDISGRWLASIDDGHEAIAAVAEFSMAADETLEGTFMTETGDYRYLSGRMVGDKMWLSTFDGTHAYLFHAKVQPDGHLEGIFKSGSHYTTTWTAYKDQNASLRNADSLTVSSQSIINMKFIDQKGDVFEIPQNNGKTLTIIQIMSSACPNCADEIQLFKEIKKLDQIGNQLEIVGVSFERPLDSLHAWNNIQRYKERLDIPYPLLYGGPYTKKAASDVFPFLNEIVSFPTFIVLNNKGEILRIHTGFSGPATSEYKTFKSELIQFLTEQIQKYKNE